MEIITELDGYQAALSKINMNESVMPYVNGRLVSEKAYNKVQKILNCPEMIASHKYLYNLDLDQLTEDEENKIDQLYKLGCDRGFIIDDLTKYDDCESVSKEQNIIATQQPVTSFKAATPCWTIIYSATDKNGQIKTGEAYSNALSAAAAKADVNSKLSTIGYSNITILAIEQCESVSEEDIEENDYVAIPEADEDESETEDSDEESVEDEDSDDSSDDSEDSEDSAEEDMDNSSDDSEDSEDSAEEDMDNSSDDSEDSEDSDDDEEDAGDSEEDSEEDSKDSEDSDEEDSDEEDTDDSDDEEKEELDANKKAELKDKYRRTFKNTLIKCKFDKSFNDLTLEEKVKFFTALSKAWTKNEPNEFMTDKEIEQLNSVVVKEEND